MLIPPLLPTRSLPRLLALSSEGQGSIDVRLSLEETYADISPVRELENGVSLTALISAHLSCHISPHMSHAVFLIR